MKVAGTEQPEQSDDDQIYRDYGVQQPRHNQNKYPGEQRYQRRETQVYDHDLLALR